MENQTQSKPVRKNIRLPDYDYSQNGAYFVTICTQNRKCLFGLVGADSISARLADEIFRQTIDGFDHVECPKYVIIPNHFHAIIFIHQRADMESAPTLSRVVQSFKRNFTIKYIDLVKQGLLPPFNKRILQRGYYEHVIRGEADYLDIWQYIDDNPARWDEDEYFIP